MRERSLYQIKESPSPVIVPPPAPIQGLACKHCMPANAVSLTK